MVTVKLKTINVCSDCGQEIYSCKECDRILLTNETIICHENVYEDTTEHYCLQCKDYIHD